MIATTAIRLSVSKRRRLLKEISKVFSQPQKTKTAMAFWESASRNFNIRRHRKPVNEILLIPDFADPSKLRMREARTLNLELSIMVLPKG